MKIRFMLLRKKLLQLCVLATLMLVVGCAHVAIKPSAENVIAWDLQGKIAVAIDNEGGSASFTWQRFSTEGQERQNIELYGPLGVGRVIIEQINDQAQLIDSDGNIFIADNIDDLLLSRLHWPIPFDEILLWIEDWRIKGKDNLQSNAINDNWLVDVRDEIEKDGRSYPRRVFFTAKPDFLIHVGNVLSKSVAAGKVAPPKFELPPQAIKVKIIFQTIK